MKPSPAMEILVSSLVIPISRVIAVPCPAVETPLYSRVWRNNCHVVCFVCGTVCWELRYVFWTALNVTFLNFLRLLDPGNTPFYQWICLLSALQCLMLRELCPLAGAWRVDEGLLSTMLHVCAKSRGDSKEQSLKASMLGHAGLWWF